MRVRLARAPDADRSGWRPTPFASLRRVPATSILMRAGEPATTFYLVRKGQLRTFVLGSNGRETTTAVLGTGQLLGIGPLLGLGTYHEFAEALGEVEVWALPTDRLLTALPHERDLRGLVLGALVQRLAQGVALLTEVVLAPAAERAEHVELMLTAQLGEAPRMTRRAFAGLIGVRPETLSRATHRPAAADMASPPGILHIEPRAVGSGAAAANAAPDLATDSQWADLPVQAYVPGQSILRDSAATCAYVVKSGVIRLVLADARGRQMVVDRVQTGQCFGLPPLNDPRVPGLRAEAESAASAWVLAPGDLLRVLDAQPQLCRWLMAHVAQRLARVEHLLHCARAPGARARLASFLIEVAHARLGDSAASELDHTWTHAALAQAVGLRRETVTRALAGLQAEGLIRRHGRRLVVCDPARLARLYGLR